MIGLRRKASLLLAASLIASLGACSDDATQASAPTPSPSPSPTPGPSPTPAGPAADCPADFANGGVIADKRNCILPNRIIRDLVVPRRVGTVYSLSGRVDVGQDIGGMASCPAVSPSR